MRGGTSFPYLADVAISHHIKQDVVMRAARRVMCMGCGRLSPRQEFQDLLERLNPEAAAAAATLASEAGAAQQDKLRLMRAGTNAPLGQLLQVGEGLGPRWKCCCPGWLDL